MRVIWAGTVLLHKSLPLWCIFVWETRAAVRLSDNANIQECVYSLQKVHFPATVHNFNKQKQSKTLSAGCVLCLNAPHTFDPQLSLNVSVVAF
jgi:hypothetical protein